MLIFMMPYFAVRIFAALTRRDVDGRGAAALGPGMLFLFTGIGHFANSAGPQESPKKPQAAPRI
jgi:hypothetical protein